MNIKWLGSANKSIDRKGYKPKAIVVHIMEGTLQGTDEWFKNPKSNVSAHYGIGNDGAIHQYVAETDTAWHAGRKTKDAPWELLRKNVNPNLYTVGIEHEGNGETPWSAAMLKASAALIHEVCLRWHIPIDRRHIVGHREIYTVKSCPGNWIDMDLLVKMALDVTFTPEKYNFVPEQSQVMTRVDLNLRKQFPTAQSEKVRTVKKDTTLQSVGWTSNGQSVNGNSHWYKDSEGNYFWAGGTTRPIPGI